MVMRIRKTGFMGGLLLLAGLVGSVPAAAEGILEQLEKEVASLSLRTKSAVVSIEDAEAGARPSGWRPNRVRNSADKARAALQKQRGRSQEEEEDHDDEIREKILEGLDRGRDAFEKEMDRAQDDRDKLQEKLGKLLEEEVSLHQKYSDSHPQVQRIKAQIKATQAQIDAQKLVKQNLLNALTMSSFNPFGEALVAPKSGTGFSIGDGYIVTTADVVEGMKSPLVVTDDGTRIKAKVVGMNTDLNIGLVKLEAKVNIPALKLGDSSTVAAGHFAVSVGNQSGQPNSVALVLVGGIRSEGAYSGNRFYPSLIQIAGTVGAGTSGAPLVNSRGEVIGMMAAVAGSDFSGNLPGGRSFFRPDAALRNFGRFGKEGATLFAPPSALPPPAEKKPGKVEAPKDGLSLPSPDAPPRPLKVSPPILTAPPAPAPSAAPWVLSSPVTSAGFAVPINEIKPVVEELRTGHPVIRAWIGIAPRDENRVEEKDGVVTVLRTVKVEGVFPDSPAFRGGVQPGDVLVSLNGKEIRRAVDVREISVRLRPNAPLQLVFKREGKTQTISLRVEPRPEKIKSPITAPIKESL